MNNTTKKDDNGLQDMVNSIANDLSNGIELTEDDNDTLEETGQEIGDMMYAGEYLRDCLDIKYIINGDMSYHAAKVLVAFGGPNIWINTDTMQVEGHWWGDHAYAGFTDTMGIDDHLEEYYECSKG